MHSVLFFSPFFVYFMPFASIVSPFPPPLFCGWCCIYWKPDVRTAASVWWYSDFYVDLSDWSFWWTFLNCSPHWLQRNATLFIYAIPQKIILQFRNPSYSCNSTNFQPVTGNGHEQIRMPRPAVRRRFCHRPIAVPLASWAYLDLLSLKGRRKKIRLVLYSYLIYKP
jgi:hypothetical protein